MLKHQYTYKKSKLIHWLLALALFCSFGALQGFAGYKLSVQQQTIGATLGAAQGRPKQAIPYHKALALLFKDRPISTGRYYTGLLLLHGSLDGIEFRIACDSYLSFKQVLHAAQLKTIHHSSNLDQSTLIWA